MGNPNERCGEVLNRDLTPDEKMLVMDLHNQKRMHIANGLEERGDPGPQPSAANMMELVSLKLYESVFSFYHLLKQIRVHLTKSIVST